MYTLVESKDYEKDCAGLASIERLDDILVGLTWAIAKKPSAFPLVGIDGQSNLRLAKSEQVYLGSEEVVLRIWFEVMDESKVRLLRINTRVVNTDG